MTDVLRDLLTTSVEGLLDSAATGSALRERVLAEGWQQLAKTEPEAITEVLFLTQGRRVTPASPLLDLVVLAAVEEVAGLRSVDSLQTTAVVYPVGLESGALSNPTCGRLDGDELTVDGVALSGEPGGELLIPVSVGDRVTLASCRLGDGWSSTPSGGMDPTLGLQRVRFRTPAAEVLDPATGSLAWREGVVAARRALSFEIVGVVTEMLETSVAYTNERHQFGRPIGSFQAVRHRLADVYIALEAARLALGESWAGDVLQVATAKSLAGYAHALAAQHCLQVTGAIGFTADYPLHRLMRRGWVLDVVLGSWRKIDAEIGAQLVAEGRVPRFGGLANGATTAVG